MGRGVVLVILAVREEVSHNIGRGRGGGSSHNIDRWRGGSSHDIGSAGGGAGESRVAVTISLKVLCVSSYTRVGESGL